VNVAMGAKSAESAAFVLGWLKSKGGDWPRSLQHVVRYISPDALPGVFELARTLESKPARDQLSIIRGVQQGCQERGMKLPDAFSAWAQSAVGSAFKSDDKSLTTEAIKLCRDLKLEATYAPLEELAQRGKSQELRLAAIDALPAIGGGRAVASLSKIVGASEEPLGVRQKAVQ